MSLGSSDVFRFFVFLFSMQIRFFPWRWSELQIKIFSYLFCRIFSISYSILHCKMLFENGFKRRIRWRNNGVGATVDSEMKMHWNEEVLRILALHFWGLSDLESKVLVIFRVRYLVSDRSGITYLISQVHYFFKQRVFKHFQAQIANNLSTLVRMLSASDLML